jgi:hypothetical protein
MDNKQPVFKRIYEEFFTIPDFFEAVNKKALLEDPYDELYEKIPLSERIAKQITIKSEFEFDTFLKNLDIRQDKLEWGVVSYGGKSSMIADILYPFDISPGRLDERKKSYWNEENHKARVKEDLMLISFPKKDSPDDLNFWITRIEKWNIEKKGSIDFISKLISRKYVIFLPGVTEEDISLSNDGMLEKSKVQEGLDILENVGLIKAKELGEQIRYIIADNQLHDLISAIKTAFISELNYLLTKWELFEVPNIQERERMESIFGKKFGRLATQLEIKLYEHKMKMRSCEDVDAYNDLLKKDYISSSFGEFILDGYFNEYKNQRIMFPTTRNEKKKDIERFRKYLMNKLQRKVDELIMTYDEEGIEELKIDFGAIVEKYSFLREIMGKVCPKVFEPPNKELQAAIVRRATSREMAAAEFTRQMDAITHSSMESDRRVLKHVEYIHGKNGRVIRILNLDKMLDEEAKG